MAETRGFELDRFFTDFYGFAKIGHNILRFLDPTTLDNCRRVSKPWKNFIDNEKVLIQMQLQNVKQFITPRLFPMHPEWAQIFDYFINDANSEDMKYFLDTLKKYCSTAQWNFLLYLPFDVDSPSGIKLDEHLIKLMIESPYDFNVTKIEECIAKAVEEDNGPIFKTLLFHFKAKHPNEWQSHNQNTNKDLMTKTKVETEIYR